MSCLCKEFKMKNASAYVSVLVKGELNKGVWHIINIFRHLINRAILLRHFMI